MTKRPWMPLYVNDYITDTKLLSPEQHGIYLLLLMVAWQRNGALLNDKEWLRRNLPPMHGRTYNALVPPILEQFFHLDENGQWRSKRLQKEIEIALKVSRKQTENVSKRWSRVKENKELDDTTVIPTQHNTTQHNTEGSKIDAPPTAAPRVVKRALPLPIGWEPSIKAFELAEQHGQNVQVVESIFRDYLASSGKLYRDYDAAFHNFIRNQQSFNRGSSNGVRQSEKRGSIIDAADRAIAKLEREIAAEKQGCSATILSLPSQRLR